MEDWIDNDFVLKSMYILFVVAFITACVIAIKSVVFYTPARECQDTVNITMLDIPESGEVLMLDTDETKTISVPRSSCIGIDDVNANDTFKAVIVRDDKGAIQYVVKVKDGE